MLTVLAVVAFVVGLVVHESGDEFVTLNWEGWFLVGLALLAASQLWDVRPWNRP